MFRFLKSICPFSKNKATKRFDFAVDYHRIIFQNILKYLKVSKSLLAKRATATWRWPWLNILNIMYLNNVLNISSDDGTTPYIFAIKATQSTRYRFFFWIQLVIKYQWNETICLELINSNGNGTKPVPFNLKKASEKQVYELLPYVVTISGGKFQFLNSLILHLEFFNSLFFKHEHEINLLTQVHVQNLVKHQRWSVLQK